MARIHGRSGRLYAGLASAGTAEPVAYLKQWQLNFTVGDVDATSFDDSNKTYLAGLPDAAGSFAGFYDNATVQMYTAAQDGVARKFYLYPSTSNTGQYWFGTALFDFSVTGGVDKAVEVSGNLKAASAVAKIG